MADRSPGRSFTAAIGIGIRMHGGVPRRFLCTDCQDVSAELKHAFVSIPFKRAPYSFLVIHLGMITEPLPGLSQIEGTIVGEKSHPASKERWLDAQGAANGFTEKPGQPHRAHRDFEFLKLDARRLRDSRAQLVERDVPGRGDVECLQMDVGSRHDAAQDERIYLIIDVAEMGQHFAGSDHDELSGSDRGEQLSHVDVPGPVNHCRAI